MRIGLTTGPLPHHRFFIQRFFEEFEDELIFSITQNHSKDTSKGRTSNILKKSFQHLSGWSATQSYFLSRLYKEKSKELLEHVDFPNELDYEIEDINSDTAESIIKNSDIDILIVFGGRIIKSNILRLPKRESYTLHLGWCPDYKGSHGLHWAIHDESINKIGLSILTLSDNVDSGEIVLRKKIELSSIKDEYDLTAYAQRLAIEEIINIVKRIKKTNKLPPTQPQANPGKVYFSKQFTPEIKGRVRRNMKKFKNK